MHYSLQMTFTNQHKPQQTSQHVILGKSNGKHDRVKKGIVSQQL